jgi:hypothetical protein
VNNQQLKKNTNIKKKVGCTLTDCGVHFTFTIGENVLALADEKKRLYSGVCKKCHKSIKLNAPNLLTFQSVYGKTTIVVMKSSFNSLFEENND